MWFRLLVWVVDGWMVDCWLAMKRGGEGGFEGLGERGAGRKGFEDEFDGGRGRIMGWMWMGEDDMGDVNVDR